MKNMFKVLNLAVFLAVIGSLFTACPEPQEDSGMPKLTGTVSITGTAQVGQTLTADTSALSGYNERDYYNSFQWKRGSTNIGSNYYYTVQDADVGSTITVTVTSSGCSGSVTSEPTAIIAGIDTPAPGLDFTLISNGTAYSVSRGSAYTAIVVIPAIHDGLPVTAIASSGFQNYTDMTGIVMPDSVTNIGSSAFSGCSGLTSIIIPTGVTGIGDSTFSGCTGLSNVVIPSSMKNIGNYAFFYCSSLAAVYYGGANGSAWNAILTGSNNTPLTSASRYYYSAAHPGTLDTHWRFADGVPAAWGTGQTFNITFAQLEDFAPNITGPNLRVIGSASETTKAISVANPTQYDSYSIKWYFKGIQITGDAVSGSYGEILSLSSSVYKNMGTYFVTVEVKKDGKLYSKAISFAVGL